MIEQCQRAPCLVRSLVSVVAGLVLVTDSALVMELVMDLALVRELVMDSVMVAMEIDWRRRCCETYCHRGLELLEINRQHLQ